MTVDAEKLLIAWALDQDDLTAIVDRRVYTELPKTKAFPLVRFTLLDERQTTRVRWHTESFVQADCYGGPKALARQTAGLLQDLLEHNITGVHELGVVTGVTFATFGYVPDGDLEPAQPRYRFDFYLYHHPNPTQPS